MSKKQLTIGIFAKENPFTNKREWSGCIYRIRRAIEAAGFKVKWIPYHSHYFLWPFLNLKARLLHGLHTKTLQLGIYAKSACRTIPKHLLQDCDILFFPGGADKLLLYLKTDKPCIYLGDATTRLMMGYYYKNNQWGTKKADSDARAAYGKYQQIISFSNWAANSFVNDYGIDKDKVHVIPIGPGLADDLITPEVKTWEKGQRLNILFSGVAWKRKGGDIAVEAVRSLRQKGIDAHLTIAGIKELPDQYKDIEFIHDVGFLNKNDPEQQQKYIQLFKDNHIFLLPTLAECAGIVFCESSGFGMPIFTNDTGGIPDYVENDVNGYRLAPCSTGEDYAQAIIKVLEQKGKLSQLSQKAREKFLRHLTWENWTKEFGAIVNNMVNNMVSEELPGQEKLTTGKE